MSPAPIERTDELMSSEDWIAVSESSPVELLQHLPLSVPAPQAAAPTDELLLRKARLKAMRSRIKEQRAELRREFARLDTERAEFEIERARFARKFERTASAGGTPEIGRRGADEPVDRRVRTPGDSTAELAAGDLQSLRCDSALMAPLPRDEHAETRDSVAEYIDRLLGRERERNGETSPPAAGILGQSLQERQDVADSDFAQCPGVPRERSQPGRRRKPDTSELRAAVSPLRELANQSARAALAKHSSRKFRRSLALPVVTAHLSWAPSSSAWEAKEGISRRMLMAQ